jgi:medium-chain acyl-[acyl-carrier-protein] hydrolase
MGAVLALEVLRRIAATRGPQGQAQALIVAGCRWPGVLDKTRRLHDLPDPAFRARLREMGGTPDEILDSDDMMALVGPMLRADFAMLHGYTHRAAPPLPVPLHILAARRDAEVAAHHLTRWPEESTAPHPVRWFDAGHFFVHEEQDAVIGTLRDILL